MPRKVRPIVNRIEREIRVTYILLFQDTRQLFPTHYAFSFITVLFYHHIDIHLLYPQQQGKSSILHRKYHVKYCVTLCKCRLIQSAE